MEDKASTLGADICNTRTTRRKRTVQALGSEYQIHGSNKRMTMEQTRKRSNGDIDFIPEHGFEGKELIPGIPNVIVAEEV